MSPYAISAYEIERLCPTGVAPKETVPTRAQNVRWPRVFKMKLKIHTSTLIP